MPGISNLTLALAVFTNVLFPIIDAQLQHNEGERVKFTFCGRLKNFQNCSIEIGRQYGKPFYKNGIVIRSSLIGNEKRRFSVEEVDSHHLIKYLVIKNVSRDDSGTYICGAYRMIGHVKEECSVERVSLTVRYPPGKANCTILPIADADIHVSSQWRWIECSATDGNIPGVLRCFQNGRLAPPAPQHRIREDNQKLVHNMLIDRKQPVKCCTNTVDERPTEANCNDFTFQPGESLKHHKSISTPSTSFPISTTTRVFHQLISHSDEEYSKSSIENTIGWSKFHLGWSGPTISVVVTLFFIAFAVVVFAITMVWKTVSSSQR